MQLIHCVDETTDGTFAGGNRFLELHFSIVVRSVKDCIELANFICVSD